MCLTCKEGLCSKCLVTNMAKHVHHDVKEIDEAFDTLLKTIKEKTKSARASLEQMRKQNTDELKEVQVINNL